MTPTSSVSTDVEDLHADEDDDDNRSVVSSCAGSCFISTFSVTFYLGGEQEDWLSSVMSLILVLESAVLGISCWRPQDDIACVASIGRSCFISNRNCSLNDIVFTSNCGFDRKDLESLVMRILENASPEECDSPSFDVNYLEIDYSDCSFSHWLDGQLKRCFLNHEVVSAAE